MFYKHSLNYLVYKTLYMFIKKMGFYTLFLPLKCNLENGLL